MRGRKTGYTTFTPEMDDIIRRDYLTMPAKEIARNIGKMPCNVWKRMKKLGLVRRERKVATQFKKGQKAYNHGMKITEFMPPDAILKCSASQFKKGTIPPNTLYDGAISKRLHKRDQKYYLWKRTGLAKWERLHWLVWEEANGKIPEGLCVAFKDGNTENCELGNLELITRKENMLRNTIVQYPTELRNLIKTNNKLKKLINEKSSGKAATEPAE